MLLRRRTTFVKSFCDLKHDSFGRCGNANVAARRVVVLAAIADLDLVEIPGELRCLAAGTALAAHALWRPETTDRTSG